MRQLSYEWFVFSLGMASRVCCQSHAMVAQWHCAMLVSEPGVEGCHLELPHRRTWVLDEGPPKDMQWADVKVLHCVNVFVDQCDATND